METNLIWLVKLLLAHFTSDFIFQTNKWVEDRQVKGIKSGFLYLHILITGVTALVFIGPEYWKAVLVVTGTHYLIDLAKAYLPQNFLFFMLDQIAHVAVIFACWATIFDLWPSWEMLKEFYHNDMFWIVAVCVLFLTYPSGYIIASATKFWSDQVINSSGTTAAPTPTTTPGTTAAQTTTTATIGTTATATNNSGLINAGKYIGIVERLIICILVYYSQYEAIGLLITGKSILRYNSSNEEIKTEYLLVGTLISIFIAFAVGLLLRCLIPPL